jgi:hypothetical protein
MHRSLITLLSTLVVATPAFSQDVFRNGRTCIPEVCIGDGLAEASKVKWDLARVNNPLDERMPITASKVSPRRKAEIEKIFRGDVSQAMPYLAGQGFDQSILPALAGVAMCEHRGGVSGTFTDKNGNPTKVFMTVVPDAKDASVQRWLVTNIERQFVAADTDKEMDAKRAEMDKVYAAAPSAESRAETGSCHMSGNRMYLTMNRERTSYQRLKEHPKSAAAVPSSAR